MPRRPFRPAVRQRQFAARLSLSFDFDDGPDGRRQPPSWDVPRPMLMGATVNAVMRSNRKYQLLRCAGSLPGGIACPACRCRWLSLVPSIAGSRGAPALAPPAGERIRASLYSVVGREGKTLSTIQVTFEAKPDGPRKILSNYSALSALPASQQSERRSRLPPRHRQSLDRSCHADNGRPPCGLAAPARN